MKKLNLCNSHQAQKRKQQKHDYDIKKQKQEVIDKWLFWLDRLLELSYIMKNMNHIMICCFCYHL